MVRKPQTDSLKRASGSMQSVDETVEHEKRRCTIEWQSVLLRYACVRREHQKGTKSHSLHETIRRISYASGQMRHSTQVIVHGITVHVYNFAVRRRTWAPLWFRLRKGCRTLHSLRAAMHDSRDVTHIVFLQRHRFLELPRDDFCQLPWARL